MPSQRETVNTSTHSDNNTARKNITHSNNKEHYKPITIALMLSLESRRSASSTTRFAHSSCFPYTSSHLSFPTSFNDWFTIVHTSSSERTSNTPSQHDKTTIRSQRHRTNKGLCNHELLDTIVTKTPRNREETHHTLIDHHSSCRIDSRDLFPILRLVILLSRHLTTTTCEMRCAFPFANNTTRLSPTFAEYNVQDPLCSSRVIITDAHVHPLAIRLFIRQSTSVSRKA